MSKINKKDIELKTELLCSGATVSSELWSYYKRSAGFPVFLNNVPVSVPAYGKYERYEYVKNSPFSLRKIDSSFVLYKNNEKLREVKVLPKPGFYEEKTSDGIEMKKILQVCGYDCLLTGVVQTCNYMRTNEECRFCGTIYNPVFEGRLDAKKPAQLAETAAAGAKEGMKHIVLSCGVTAGADRGAKLIKKAAEAIKSKTEMPIQAEIAVPKELKYLEELGGCVDSISINIETFEQDVRENACPAKSRISYEEYFKAYKLSLELFGENQVNSWIILGIGENDKSLLEGAEKLASLGVFPFLAPLRPTKGTGFGELLPPSPDRLREVSVKIADIAKKYGLKPEKNKAGCLRCSSCSPVKDYVLSK